MEENISYNNGNRNGNKIGNGTVSASTNSSIFEKQKAASGFADSISLRLPEAFVVLSPDQANGEKVYQGYVGFKYGPAKEDWLRIPYTSMKKVIDFCMEHKDLFNKQLQKERQKNQVSDL